MVMEDNLIEKTTISHIFEAANSLSSAEVVKNETGVVVKENTSSRMGNFSDESHSIVSRRKKLIILDVNGLLADFVAKVPTGCKPDLTISRKGVLFQTIQGGCLVIENEEKLGHGGRLSNGRFEAQTTLLLGHYFSRNFEKYGRLEPDLPWKIGEFNASNTILLDDSPYKALLNPANTSIFPLSYCYNDSEDASLGPGGDLRVYLEGIAMAENVQDYIEQNPFGQSPVTESHPSWEFYRLIVHSVCAKVEEEEENTSKALPAS